MPQAKGVAIKPILVPPGLGYTQAMSEGTQRRLAAIVSADVVGYSRLMGIDEAGTIQALRAHRAELIDSLIAEHGGRIVKTMGDGLLLEFPSVVEAVKSAIAVQDGMAARNEGVADDKRIVFRFGINLGDIIIDGEDILGDGVNIAARVEGLADPGGICLSRAARDQVRDKLNVVLDDMGEVKVKNIARPIRVFRVLLESEKSSDGKSAASTRPAHALPDKPSIAVLPFDNMSGDPDQEYFADGIVEEIITALSNLPWFLTVARNSSFVYKGQAVDVQQVSRELGARYILQGSIRKAGGRVRISAQLIETENRGHLWANRFDGSLEDIFDLQDQITIGVVGAITPSIQDAEIVRAESLRSKNLTAYDSYLRALPHYRMHTADGFKRALAFLCEARSLDPNFALATALAAHCMVRPILGSWVAWSDECIDEAIFLARESIVGGTNDPLTLVYAATVLAFAGREHDLALILTNRALSLAPYSAEVLECVGWIEMWSSEQDRAIEHLEIAQGLNPKYPAIHDIFTGLAAAHFYAEHYETAVGWARKSLAQRPNLAVALRYLSASLAQLDRLDEARVAIEELLSIQPHSTVSMVERTTARMAKDRSMIEQYLNGLRKAGLPQGEV